MSKGSMSFTFSEKDFQNLQRMLGDISEVDKRQAIINSLKRGTRNMVRGGKRNLASRNQVTQKKKKGGHLHKSFKTTSSKKKVVAYAGFARSGENVGNHAHLVDRGTVKRWALTRNGKPLKKPAYRGHVSKNAPKKGSMFWTDAVMSQGPKAMENLKNTIYKELVKITNRKS